MPNGVDLERFAPAPRPGGEAGVVIGSVATFRPVKNQALLLDAFARFFADGAYRDSRPESAAAK